MKSLRKVLLSLLIAASMGAVSTHALAEDPGRIVYAPTEAIDLVGSKIQAAIDAAKSGTKGEELAVLIKDASDASKEINANDKVDVARSRANGVLKNARSLAKKGSDAEALTKLEEAAQKFAELKGML